jgi:zinc protease
MFRGHPYERDILGTVETLNRLDSKKIKTHWEKMVNPANAIFVAVGDFKPDRQLKFFEEITAGMPKGIRHQERFAVEPLKGDARYFSKSEKEQTHIILGYRGISFQDPDRYVLDVLEAILAGQGGRLFAELREKASLAYSVAPFNMKGIDTGYVGVYIGCSPEKGPKAISMMKEELQKIVERAPTEIEVQRAKRYLVGRNHIDLQRNGAQASSILFDELYDLDCEETFKFAEHLKEITPADIQRVARRLFTAASITVAVGPVEPW